MTEYLQGNHVIWATDGSFRTKLGPSSGVRDFEVISYMKVGFFPLINNLINITLMPLPGKVVGMITHVLTNTFSPSLNAQFEFVKTEDSGTTFIPTGVKCVIPGMQTGFFYSDPDISEFTRSWEKNEYIALRKTPEAGNNATGIGPNTTIMICLDIDN